MTGPSSTVYGRGQSSQNSSQALSVPIEKTQLECEELVTHLQNVAELKDIALSHELHDELGGLMGAAVMDPGKECPQ